MRLIKARVKGYRSIMDSGYFDIEKLKTILVGPNEAGKTALLQALQKLNPADGKSAFEPLRDYPRSKYDSDIVHKAIDPNSFTVVEGHFVLDDREKGGFPEEYKDAVFVFGRYLNNESWNRLENCPERLTYRVIEKDLLRLLAHIKDNIGIDNTQILQQGFDTIVTSIVGNSVINVEVAGKLIKWLDSNIQNVTAGGTEEQRFDKIKEILAMPSIRANILTRFKELLPKFVLFNNYFRVHPSIHLGNLAKRIEQKLLDDEQYDYGNICLLNFLGFDARELSSAGAVATSEKASKEEIQKYKDTLDNRTYRLNAASIRLTNEIRRVWNPVVGKGEASKLKIEADGQYLKVVVEDSLGVEVELNQRSEGFQWLVSFFIVFFSETTDAHKNTILLLDEPGLSLHGLKQAEFRETLTRLSQSNQTIFTTHSPFLVGSNELDLVRVVEMLTREDGTAVHTSVTAADSAALLPLQEALGYDLAQSLFFHKRNLVLEGLTDYWYIEAISCLLEEAGKTPLDENIAMIPANSASKVVYFATILHANNLKVSALLDSDAEGDTAAKQETLINALGNKRILRTKDVYKGNVAAPEIEDLFRDTLIIIANKDLGWNVKATANKQKTRPIVDVFNAEIKDFSKYKLAKTFLRWARDHSLSDLTEQEQGFCSAIIEKINKSLK